MKNMSTAATSGSRLDVLAFSLPGFAAFAAAMFVLGYAYARRAPWWATLSMASGAAFVALFTLTTLGFAQHPHLVGAAGLLQWLTVGVGWLWLTLVAARGPRRPLKALSGRRAL